MFVGNDVGGSVKKQLHDGISQRRILAEQDFHASKEAENSNIEN
jgi:hypothetical protein